jgi:hypothetical protein
MCIFRWSIGSIDIITGLYQVEAVLHFYFDDGVLSTKWVMLSRV